MSKRSNGEGSIFKQWRWNSTTPKEVREKKKELAKKKNQKGTGDYFIWVGEFVDYSGITKRINGRRNEKQEDVRKRLEQAIESDKCTLHVDPTEITMKDVVNKWIHSKRDIEPETLSVYTQYSRDYITRHIGSIPIQKVTKDNVENLFNILIKSGSKKMTGLSPATIKKVKNVLHSIFDYAIQNKYITSNLVDGVTIPRVQKTIINPLTPTQIAAIESKMSTHRLYPIFYLDITTGLRRGELLGLRWEDVDLINGYITIRQQMIDRDKVVKFKPRLKTDGSFRRVALTSKALELLKKYKKTIDTEKQSNDYHSEYNLVVCKENGMYIRTRRFKDIMDKMLTDSGVAQMRIHGFRHTFATLLLSNGAYVNEVQLALGQADPRTTLGVYGQILPGRQKELANRLDNILK